MRRDAGCMRRDGGNEIGLDSMGWGGHGAGRSRTGRCMAGWDRVGRDEMGLEARCAWTG